MKATRIVSTVAGALLISALAFAGSDSKQTHAAKPAGTQKVPRMAAHPVGKQGTSASDKKQEAKPVMKQTTHLTKKGTTPVAKVATKKTAARRRIHHVKHQPKKTDAQIQVQKKS